MPIYVCPYCNDQQRIIVPRAGEWDGNRECVFGIGVAIPCPWCQLSAYRWLDWQACGLDEDETIVFICEYENAVKRSQRQQPRFRMGEIVAVLRRLQEANNTRTRLLQGYQDLTEAEREEKKRQLLAIGAAAEQREQAGVPA